VWRASEGGGIFDALVRFLFLSGARRSEAAGITWTEITGNVWRLPAARNKGKVDLLRPLSKAALALLHAQPRILGSDLIFTLTGNIRFRSAVAKKILTSAVRSRIGNCTIQEGQSGRC
jgi:integrase